MAKIISLGEFEQIVVLAILRLDQDAYGVTIVAEIRKHTGRNPASGALYATLDRLEAKGILKSRLGDPTPQRGGRAKRFFEVTPPGIKAIAKAQQSYRSLMLGLRLPELNLV